MFDKANNIRTPIHIAASHANDTDTVQACSMWHVTGAYVRRLIAHATPTTLSSLLLCSCGCLHSCCCFCLCLFASALNLISFNALVLFAQLVATLFVMKIQKTKKMGIYVFFRDEALHIDCPDLWPCDTQFATAWTWPSASSAPWLSHSPNLESLITSWLWQLDTLFSLPFLTLQLPSHNIWMAESLTVTGFS